MTALTAPGHSGDVVDIAPRPFSGTKPVAADITTATTPINYPAARLVGEPFGPEPFGRELRVERLMAEGLKSSGCGV